MDIKENDNQEHYPVFQVYKEKQPRYIAHRKESLLVKNKTPNQYQSI